MTKKEIIRIIHDSAKKYCENLNGRNLLIVYQDSGVSVKTLEVSFTGTNFLHLTGVKTEKNASEFYSAALSGRIKENDFDIASDGTTVLKMKVISSLLNGNLSAKMIGDYDSSFPKLYTEKLAGGVKGCLGFVKDKETGAYYPNTLLYYDIRSITIKPLRIICVLRKEFSDLRYSEITYKAKGIELSGIAFPSEFEYLKENEI